MNKRFYIFLPFLLMLFGIVLTPMHAQEVVVHAALDSSKIRIGEQVKIDLVVSYSGNQNIKILWPDIGDTLRKEIEVVNVSKIDTTIPDKTHPDRIQQHQKVTITSFDSGYWAIQPFVFVINGDTTHPLETEPLLLEVKTIPVDTSEASIKDIKAPFDEPFLWKELLPYMYWGIGIIAAIAILIFIYFKFFKKQQPKIIEPPAPKEAPHIVALRELQKIKDSKLWQEGYTKEYYTGITDTLRMYIEGRYKVHAMELTTEEIMSVMKSQVIDTASKEKLEQVLSLADYVKFAKAKPIEIENELVWNNAIDFVKGTLREEQNNSSK